MVTVYKLVLASNFIRQSRYKRLVGKLSVGGPGRKVSCLPCHGDPASGPKPDGSHPGLGRAESVTTGTLMG